MNDDRPPLLRAVDYLLSFLRQHKSLHGDSCRFRDESMLVQASALMNAMTESTCSCLVHHASAIHDRAGFDFPQSENYIRSWAERQVAISLGLVP